jgi:hypothetical protein
VIIAYRNGVRNGRIVKGRHLSRSNPKRGLQIKSGVHIFLALVVLGLAIAAICNVPLSYDNAYYLFDILDRRGTMAPYHRFLNIPLQMPTLMAMRWTANLTLLRLIFSACYASIPAVALVGSWLVCRDTRPALFIWPALATCLAGLPGQFIFNEAIAAPNLLWPALLCALTRPRAVYLPIVAVLTLAALTSHPTSAAMLGLIAIAAFLDAWIVRDRVGVTLCYGLVSAALAAARAAIPLSAFERGRLGFGSLKYTFHSFLLGLPLVAVILILATGYLCLWSSRPGRRFEHARLLVNGLVILIGAVLVVWAVRPGDWIDCLGYEFWFPGMTLIMMAAAAADAILRPRSADATLVADRSITLVLIGAVFLIVFSLQSWTWAGLSQRLRATLERSDQVCIEKSSLDWMKLTALQHWSCTYYALDLQTRQPRTLLLNARCEEFARTGLIYLSPWVGPRVDGWFDFSVIQARHKESLDRH